MPAATFSILDVSSWRIAADEVAGADEKVWLAPTDSEDRWLFKPATIKDDHVHGEDWAEKAASELGHLLGVPCATVEMANRHGSRGALSLNLRPPNYEMHSGAVLLSDLLADYVPGAVDPLGRPGHNLSNINAVLGTVAAPPGFTGPTGMTGFDVFAGILMLDAWIANRDRHDENWSILVPHAVQDLRRLCGSYDQAGCLGFNLLDTSKARMLAEGRVAAWARKGTAWRFEHTAKPSSLVTLAAEGLSLASTTARRHWMAALCGITDEVVADLMARIPVLSEVGRTFAVEVLATNRKRLLDECH
jgi:hypothetical protein